MVIQNFEYFLIGLITATILVFFHYIYKTELDKKKLFVLVPTRFVTYFIIILILLNPVFSSKSIHNQKPRLSILLDNSFSIKHTKQDSFLLKKLDSLKIDKILNNKFNISYFKFSSQLKTLDSLNFKDKQTNISNALKSLQNTISDNETVLILTDGNYTSGNDYANIKSKASINSIIIGDTILATDLKIHQINSNKYSIHNNKFPVEIIVQKKGKYPVRSKLSIYKNQSIVYGKNLEFATNENSKIINLNLHSDTIGLNQYTARILPLDNEKNKENNHKSFVIDVISKKSKIILLSDIVHPDIGAINKAINSSGLNRLIVKDFNTSIEVLKKSDLIIIYQANKNAFPIFKKILDEKLNYFLITGTKTSWETINNLNIGIKKETTNLIQQSSPVLNPSFSNFNLKNVFFNDLSPLDGFLGALSFKKSYKIMFYKKTLNRNTSEPLLLIKETKNHKAAFLFGEQIWKWRINDYVSNKSFANFDIFINDLTFNLKNKQKKERLTIEHKLLYNSGSDASISAQFFYKNYTFNNHVKILLKIRNIKSNEKETIPLVLSKNNYRASLNHLNSGSYTFEIFVENTPYSKTGKFIIESHNLETVFYNPNVHKLKLLAEYNNGGVFYNFSNFKKNILNKKISKPTIEKYNNLYLSNLKSLLVILLISLSVEWFYRRYIGKI